MSEAMRALSTILLAVSAAGKPFGKKPWDGNRNETLCETSQKADEELHTRCTFEEGKSVKIVAFGDVDEGCKFVQSKEDGRVCCYMARVRNGRDDPELCDRTQHSSGCRAEADFLVTENKLDWDHGKCTLKLPNYKATDNGEYKAVFPDNKRNKSNKIINVGPELEDKEGTSLGTTAIVGLLLAALIAGSILLTFFIVKKRNEGEGGVPKEESHILVDNVGNSSFYSRLVYGKASHLTAESKDPVQK